MLNELTLDEMLHIANSVREWQYESECVFKGTLKLQTSRYVGVDIQIYVGYENTLESACEEKYFLEFRNYYHRDVPLGKLYGEKVRSLFDKVNKNHERFIQTRKSMLISKLRDRYAGGLNAK